MDKEIQPKRKKWLWPVIGIAAAIVSILLWLCLSRNSPLAPSPTLKLESPQKRTFGDSAPFTVDVTLSGLGEALYPAASLSVDFDRSRLEFLGIEEGNLLVSDGDSSGGKLPEWSVDPEQCNKTGIIRIMYLDMTGGRYAFSEKLADRAGNVVLRLSFRLRGSARRGDVYELNVADAVFAANEEAESLSSAQGTLRTVNGRIAVER